jgi:DNA polymerase delta subunit 1
MNDLKSNHDNLTEAVLDTFITQKRSVYGYQGEHNSDFIKITLAYPRLIAAAKRLLDRREVRVSGVNDANHIYQAYEANIDFEIRFMADTKVVGCNWIELPPGKHRVRQAGKTTTRSQIEVDISWDDFVSHAPEGEWADVAPFTILSFDIECAGRKGIFPVPEKDPVIQIANMVIRQVCE